MSGRWFAAGLGGVLLVAAVLVFWGADSVPMRNDEAAYALLADNLRHGGPWLRLQHWWVSDRPYLDKPPLFFWLSAATDWAIGFRPLAFRFWSGLAGLRRRGLHRPDRARPLWRRGRAAGRAGARRRPRLPLHLRRRDAG
ncbi:MAG: hypothetical protein U1E53_06430 [Dongiaceae bacterium]